MEKKQVASFRVSIPKSARSLAKFVSKDPRCEALNYVGIIPFVGVIAASDSHILRCYDAECHGDWPSAEITKHGSIFSFSVLVEKEHIIKLAGSTVDIKVYEYQKEVEAPISIGHPRTKKELCKFCTVEANGAQVYDGRAWNFPDATRAIPNRSKCSSLLLSKDNLRMLKSICKTHKKDNYIALAYRFGSKKLAVSNECQGEAAAVESVYRMEMEKEAGECSIIGFNPQWLAKALDDCNGLMYVNEEGQPAIIEGECKATVIMPAYVCAHTKSILAKALRS